MHMIDVNELRERLENIDKLAYIQFSEVFEESNVPHPQVVIIGGSSIMLHGLDERDVTKDIDVYEADAVVHEALRSDKLVNFDANAYACDIPYNYEKRLKHLDIGTGTVDFCIPSMEDLAVMKLYRWEDIDKQDMSSEEYVSEIDWSLLRELVYSPGEAEASRITEPEYDRDLAIMRRNYEEYEREFGPRWLRHGHEEEGTR